MPIVEDGQTVAYFFDCPGCNCGHAPYVQPHKAPNGASWKFNGNLEKPTFRPSILTRVELSSGKVMICHSYVTDGKIEFLYDSTHALAGQAVDLPDLDE